MQRSRSVIAVLTVSLAVAACGSGGSSSSSDEGGVTTLTMAVGATTAASIPLWVGTEQGIFADHHLKIDTVLLSGTKAPPALASGSVQLASSGIPDLAGAIVAGNDMTIVGTTYPYNFFQIYGKEGLTSAADLRGKTIAASSPGSSSDTAITVAMEGMERGKDYQVTYVGDNGARLAALTQGVVDAIVVSPPTAQQAAAQGFSLVVDLIAEKSPFGYSAIGVDKGWAKDNHDVLVEYLQAYAESVQYAKDHPEAAYAVEKSELGLTDDAIIKSVYDVSVGLMPAYPVTDEKTVQATISLSDNAEVAAADPSSLYDNSYVEEAQKNG